MSSGNAVPHFPKSVAAARHALGRRVAAFLMLFIPLIFFAARGEFSFEFAGTSEGGFAPGTVAVRSGGLLGQILIPAVAYGLCLLLIRSRLPEILALARRSRILVALPALALLSALWSQAPLKSVVFGGCFLIDTFFAFYLVVSYDSDALLVILDRLLLIVCILGIFFIVFLPGYGLTQLDARNPNAWEGIFSDRGGAARPLLYLCAASFVHLRRRFTRGRLFTLLLGLLMVFKAHVVTVFVLLFLYLVFYAVQRINDRLAPRTSLGFLVTVTVAIVLGAIILPQILPSLLVLLGRDPTLTGRTEIWQVLFHSIAKRPLLGYGFYAFWRGLEGESGNVIHQMNWTFGYAHNGYIEVCLQLGVVGLGLFFASLLQALRNVWLCLRFHRGAVLEWSIGLILITIFYNIDDCTILWPKDLLSILYVVSCCRLALAAAQLRPQPLTLKEAVTYAHLSSAR